jgi:hypothetical protein
MMTLPEEEIAQHELRAALMLLLTSTTQNMFIEACAAVLDQISARQIVTQYDVTLANDMYQGLARLANAKPRALHTYQFRYLPHEVKP